MPSGIEDIFPLVCMTANTLCELPVQGILCVRSANTRDNPTAAPVCLGFVAAPTRQSSELGTALCISTMAGEDLTKKIPFCTLSPFTGPSVSGREKEC